MNGLSKSLALAVTMISSAVILVTAFAWFGPGLGTAISPASASLFDEEVVQAVYDRVSPAVVDVNVERKNGDSFSRLGFGSGFVIDSQGYVVTNNHVIQQADRVRVSFQDGTSAIAEVLGTSPANDLALLKVPSEAVSGIDPVPLGDSSKVRPGQLAIAIGSPFGLDGSVTVGVISGVDRTLDSDINRPISGVLQTDALINPGNSGGPLLNRSGEVVGINTAIQVSALDLASLRPTRRNIGFAVPINTLAALLPDLKTGKVVRPPWLGISAVSLDSASAESLGLVLEQNRGVYVTQVMPGSPAQEAGLIPSGAAGRGEAAEGGDIIVAVVGAKVGSVGDLIAQLNRYLPGAEIELTLIRDGQEIGVMVTLGEWPSDFTETRRSRILPLPDGETFPRSPGLPNVPGIPLPDLFPHDHGR